MSNVISVATGFQYSINIGFDLNNEDTTNFRSIWKRTSRTLRKMLQSFAEKCDRSGERQMHITLISHKEISNYIDNFAFVFIDGRELTENVNWKIKSEGIEADGVIYGILPESEERISEFHALALATSPTNRQTIFGIPKHYRKIEGIVREYKEDLTLYCSRRARQK